MSNLKQIGLALRQYVQDYDENLPCSVDSPRPLGTTGNNSLFGTGWQGWISNVLAPYEKNSQIYQCPSFSTTWAINQTKPPRTPGPPFAKSYNYNYRSLGGAWGSRAWAGAPDHVVKEARIPEPATLAAMWDSSSSWADCGYMGGCGIWNRDLCWYLKTKGRPLSPGMSCDNVNMAWHQDRQNMLFVDGHVKLIGWEQVKWSNISHGAQVGGNVDRERPVLQMPTDPQTAEPPWP
jgi:prepilin-type processing-associated H-X9-DG protein